MLRPALTLAAMLVSAIASADGPLWSQPLDGPDWVAPRDAVQNSLRVDAQGAHLFTNEFGVLWRFQVDNSGVVRQRDAVADAQLYSRASLLGQWPDLVFTLTGSTANLDLQCALQRQNPDGSRRWRWSHPVNGLDIQPCLTVVQLDSGAVVFADRLRVASLDDDGAERWSTAFADHALSGFQAQRVLPVSTDRLLVVGSAPALGVLHLQVWTLDAHTGAPLDVQALQAGRLLASSGVRTLAAGEFELLAQLDDDANAADQLLHLRISSTGRVLQSTALEPFGAGARMGVAAHASGFAAVGLTAGAPELRVYDATKLRWRMPARAVTEQIGVAADGATALAGPGAVERFSSAGVALPAPLLPAVAQAQVLGLQHAPDGSLWVQSQGGPDQFPREINLSRYGPAAAALHSTRISLPQDGPDALSMHRATDGSLRYLGLLRSASAQLAVQSLVLRAVDRSGAVEAAAQVLWPDRSIEAAAGLQDGWVVLDQAIAGGDLQLHGLSLDGALRWRLAVDAADAALRCDQHQLCALSSWAAGVGGQVRLIDSNGAVLGSQAGGGSVFLAPVVDGERLRGLQFDSAKTRSTLLAVDALPMSILADSTDPALYATRLGSGQWPLQNTVLGWLPDRLSAYGMAGVQWSLPHAGDLVALANRHNRLFAVQQSTIGVAQRVLRIDPGSGAVQNALELPASAPRLRTGCKQIQAAGSRFGADHACVDAVDDNVRWLLAQSADGATGVLLADRRDQPLRTVATSIHASELLALPGDAVLLQASGGGSTEPSRLSLYQVELFRDGME